MKRGLRVTTAVLLLSGLLGFGAALASFQLAVHRDPDNTFTRAGILKILSRESVVYYADGKTQLGAFFQDEHRDYVPFDSIPKTIVDALVSAEDHNYWKHGGMDFKGFALAMLDNLKSMSLKRGGSTLTQQTAKNLFGRRGRTVRGKLEELVNAYRLERHFTKQEILEFYLNQFFVTGNGHGVRIAARYFFDKELHELSLVECAFIAASVKGPNQYNPFLAETAEKKKAVLQRVHYRVAYVLKQMRRHDKISEAQYRRALVEKLVFRRGTFRYSLSTNMVTIKHLLDSPEMQQVLSGRGIDDYMTAGLQITTTLDPEIQRATEYAVYSNLWRLDLLLRGYHPPPDTAADLLSHFIPGEFDVGRVISLELRNGAPATLQVRFGTLDGIVPQSSLELFFRQWNRHQTGSDAIPSPKAMAAFASKYLRPGQLVFCAAPYRTPEELAANPHLESQLELAQKPLLQGAAQVVQAGKVLANVGGFGNTGYDRVNQAQRQFGSAFKPLVYAAALELGWKPLDAIPNSRQLFRIGSLFYYPKPDHPPEDTVSMAWAGRRSENIASVRLLFNLFDKTDFAHFWEACRSVHLAPENFSSQGQFDIFVRDSLGLVLDDDHLRELRYQKVTRDLALDLTFEGRELEAARLRELPYGAGFARQRRKLAGSRDPEDQVQLRLLERSYLDLISGSRRSAEDPSAETVRRVAEGLKKEDALEPQGSRYTPENLYASTDFRALAALRYIVAFSRKLGITSPLDPVLSYPLGVNSIALSEAMQAYQAFQDGGVYRTRFGKPQLYIQKIVTYEGQVLFEDKPVRQQVISDPTRHALEAILGAVIRGGTGQQIGRELRMQTAKDSGAGLVVPAYGKTGTTNDYRNGAFLGYVSAPKDQNGFDPVSGYTIGVYAGFDDNTPMSRSGFRGTGAMVAVPAWLSIAQNLVKLKKFSAQIDTSDAQAVSTGIAPMFEREKYRRFVVSRRTGLPITADSSAAPAYANDLADEMGTVPAVENSESATSLWMRDE